MQTVPVYNKFEAVTLSDSVDFVNGLCDAVYVGTKGSTGTLVGVLQSGATVTFVGIPAGTILPIRIKRINNTTTDVSNVVALYSV